MNQRFWNGFGEATRLKAKEQGMATFHNMVVQVYKPTVVDSAANFLRAWDKLSPQHQDLVFAALHGAENKSSTLKIACDTEEDAQKLVAVVNVLQHPTKTVKVRSETDWLKKYDVEFDLTRWIPTSCSCPDFEHRSKQNSAHLCKHMQSVSRAPASYGLYR